MCWTIWGSISGRGKSFFLFSKMSRMPFVPTQPIGYWILGSSLPGGKVGEAWSHHWLPSGVEVEDEWSCPAPPSLCLYGLHRNILTFYCTVTHSSRAAAIFAIQSKTQRCTTARQCCLTHLPVNESLVIHYTASETFYLSVEWIQVVC